MGRCHSTQAGYENEVGVYQSEPSSSGDPLGCQAAGRRERFLVFVCISERMCLYVNVHVSERMYLYLKEHDFLLTWNGETPEISVFPIKAKGLASGSTLAPQLSTEAEGRPVSIHCKELESLAQASGSLQSGEMDTALCGGEISIASCKTSLCLARFYLLIFFCDSKFTVSFIHVCFFE